MSDRLHILITGEAGKGRSVLLSRRKLKTSCFFLGGLLLTFTILSYNSLHSFSANADLTARIDTLTEQLESLTGELTERNSANDILSSQLASLERQNNQQIKSFQREKQALLNTAVSELEERSSMIERIMCNIGVDVKGISPPDNSNSGGPYIAPLKDFSKELLYRSNKYLDAIHSVPLGRPIPGGVSSRFGHREDPVNGKKGFHSGVDIRGRSGDTILATADGVVRKAFWNGGYGRYIEIDHGNGYTTKFAHMHSMSVKRGDKVTRGQKIGTVGNSGRSTGSHLHYEICLRGASINPSNFMRSDKLNNAAEIKKFNAKKSKKVKRTPLVVAQNKKDAALSEK